jgi:hypothetical protein
MTYLKIIKSELENILNYLDKSTVDGYFGTISVLETKECVNDIINGIDNKMEIDINKLKLLIAPTGAVQEISIDNGWGKEFLKISGKIDEIINGTWAICFEINIPFLYQRVIPYKLISHDMVEVCYGKNNYSISINEIRPINTPKYIIGEKVSPVNHPELIGIIYDIIYHFTKNEPMYFIKINGKKKSKRYFENDLICINTINEIEEINYDDNIE